LESGQLQDKMFGRLDVYVGWMTMMSEGMRLPPPQVPSIYDEEITELETDDTFIPPLDSHPCMHPRPHSPPLPSSSGTTAPIVA
jgi:hypothetical protein